MRSEDYWIAIKGVDDVLQSSEVGSELENACILVMGELSLLKHKIANDTKAPSSVRTAFFKKGFLYDEFNE